MAKAVLFDLDDTLVHRRRSLACYVETLCSDIPELAAQIPRSELEELVVSTDNGGYLKPGARNARVREEVSEVLVSRLGGSIVTSRADIENHWKTNFPRSAVPMPGAAELVEKLSLCGIRLAVVSNGSQRSRELTVASLPFASLIERVYSSGLVGVKKPSRGIFNYALEDLGLDASDVWFVGDHPVNDIVGATATGMRAVWLEGFHAWPEDREEPGHSAASLQRVSDFLGLEIT